MWHELANDDTFWVTVATASTALLIAVVVEGRDARERFDQLALETNRKRLEALAESEYKWKAWASAVDRYNAGEGDDPGAPPRFEPLPQDDPEEEGRVQVQGGRVATLLLALWTLTISLFGSLVLLLPFRYPSGPIPGIGIAVTLAAITFGTGALVHATTNRIRNN